MPKSKTSNIIFWLIFKQCETWEKEVISSTNSMWNMEEIKKVIAYLSTNVEMGLAVHDQIINELPIIDH